MHQYTEVTVAYLKDLLEVNNKKDQREQYWFPSPEQPGDLTTYTPIRKRITKTKTRRIIGITNSRTTQST